MQKFMRVFFQVLAVTGAAVMVFCYVTLYARAGEPEAAIQATLSASKAAVRSSSETKRTDQDAKAEEALQALDGRAVNVRDILSLWLQLFKEYVRKKADMLVGGFLVMTGLLFGIRLLWQSSVLLYCYDGGDEYRKLGLLYLKKGKNEFELFLPDYLVETAETPRYRLVLKSSLVKKCKNMDLVVRSEEHKLRQPLEECVDFVL
ncbi:MAG: hypothetical protein ACI4TB_11350 [Lachnospiraceae bacterium]